MPAGVPLDDGDGGGDVEEVAPPLHEPRNKMSNSSSGRCRTDCLPRELPIFRFGSTTQPMSKVTNTQCTGVKLGARRSPVAVPEVVLTLTLKWSQRSH